MRTRYLGWSAALAGITIVCGCSTPTEYTLQQDDLLADFQLSNASALWATFGTSYPLNHSFLDPASTGVSVSDAGVIAESTTAAIRVFPYLNPSDSIERKEPASGIAWSPDGLVVAAVARDSATSTCSLLIMDAALNVATRVPLGDRLFTADNVVVSWSADAVHVAVSSIEVEDGAYCAIVDLGDGSLVEDAYHTVFFIGANKMVGALTTHDRNLTLLSLEGSRIVEQKKLGGPSQTYAEVVASDPINGVFVAYYGPPRPLFGLPKMRYFVLSDANDNLRYVGGEPGERFYTLVSSTGAFALSVIASQGD